MFLRVAEVAHLDAQKLAEIQTPAMLRTLFHIKHKLTAVLRDTNRVFFTDCRENIRLSKHNSPVG